MIKNAIVRLPSPSLVAGLTTAQALGKPDYDLAMEQHGKYCKALEQCGVEVTCLPAQDVYPDACFVEDVALLTDDFAVLTRPGAPSRQGEVAEIAATVQAFYRDKIGSINAPGTLEAGDILRVENHFYIGLSARTNAAGAQQMMQYLEAQGYTASTITLRNYLHLKTGVSYLDCGIVLVSGELIKHPQLSQFQQVEVTPEEEYAANCIMVNGQVLMPAGFPKTQHAITALGLSVIPLDVSEFRKIDGGLSCLSLRF